jgi:hypothetical protein
VKRLKANKVLAALAILVWMLGAPSVAQATCANQQTCSTNYGVNEIFFGSGGDLNDCSSNYCAKTSVGETGVGNTSSTNYQARAGFNTNRTPYIQFIVNSANVNLGVLSIASTATATGTFSVKTYLASGYIVQLASNPPTSLSSGHILTALTSPTAASAGTEQFGINLVANTTICGAPANFGASPVQVPSNTFSYGAVSSGYNTCGLFQYNNGDTIASSNSSSGETDYTISYIENISSSTIAGQYNFAQILVATSTY